MRLLLGGRAVTWQGEKVVDLWGGRRTPAGGAPWNEDTMVLVNSTTKGLAAMTVAVANSRGWIDHLGTPGAGGSLGLADPDARLGFAYVMNNMDFHMFDDPREKALRDAVHRAIRRLSG